MPTTLRKPPTAAARHERVLGSSSTSSMATSTGAIRSRTRGCRGRRRPRKAVPHQRVLSDGPQRRRRGAARCRRRSATFAEPASHSLQRRRRDGVEHRLHVGGRARDHAQDLAGGGLLLERLGERRGCAPRSRELARVLDGDHRLVSEGLQQRQLARGKATVRSGRPRSRRSARRRAASGIARTLRKPTCHGRAP